jgi:hypothetical protein
MGRSWRPVELARVDIEFLKYCGLAGGQLSIHGFCVPDCVVLTGPRNQQWVGFEETWAVSATVSLEVILLQRMLDI